MHQHDQPSDQPPADALPSEEELLAGRTRDGGRPALHSHKLYPPHDKPLPGDPSDKPFQADLQAVRQQIDTKAETDLNEVIEYNQLMMRRSKALVEGGDAPKDVKAETCLRIGAGCARSLPRAIEQRRKLQHTIADRAVELDVRRGFMEDRAHAVVANTLLELDESFREVGFGSWMPFRYPDQWLMFCGLLQRVLAANGLIHSTDPDVYRRLLDETPPVESNGFKYPKKPGHTPHNAASCWTNRGSPHLDDLRSRLQEAAWEERPPP